MLIIVYRISQQIHATYDMTSLPAEYEYLGGGYTMNEILESCNGKAPEEEIKQAVQQCMQNTNEIGWQNKKEERQKQAYFLLQDLEDLSL